MIQSKIQPRINPTSLTDLRPHMIRSTKVLAGWVSPGGAYFKSGSWQHDSLATKICGADNGPQLLDDDGWIRLTDYGQPVIQEGHRFTQAQIDTLFDLANLFAADSFGMRIHTALANPVLD